MSRARLLTFPVLLGVLACGAAPAADQRPAAPAAQTPSKATAPAKTQAAAKAQAPEKFDSNRAWEHLRQMVAIGPRPSGSAGIRQTRAYITQQLAAIGLTAQEQKFTAPTPAGNIEMTNLSVRLPGRRAERILLTGHYDTKLFRDVRFVGASDGASSAAILIELARVLKTRPHEFTYEFVWFDGEEAVCKEWSDCKAGDGGPDNTYGSRHFVKAARAANALTSIKAMILFDMIGAKNLKLLRDGSSTPWLVDVFWAAAKRTGHGAVFADIPYDVGGDDHIPFMEAGIPSVDLIHLNDYPQWHTPQDDLQHVGASSLQIVGDVTLAALPDLERRLAR